MAKPFIIKRNDKGSALTFTEMDANFQNLDDATINFTDGLNLLSMDLNDVATIQGESTHNMRVTVSEDSQGQLILVDNLLGDFTQEPMGFENREDSIISFDSATRTCTITPGSTGYRIWIQGKEILKTSAESVTIPDVTGLYYIFFNGSEILSYQSDYFDFSLEAPVAYVYWNASTGTAPYFADERHGITMDWATHEYLHRTRGAAFANGFVISNFTTSGDGSLDSHAEFDLSNGTFFDEDIEVQITHSNSPVANTWQQDLQGPAQIPVFYHLGSTGEWVRDSVTNFAVKQGTSLVTYNLNTGGTWTTPDVSDTFYVAYFIVATNNLNYPVISIMGQSAWNKLDDAQNQSQWDDLDLTNFPSLEFRPLYRLIFRSATSYTNTPNAYLAAVLDLRISSVTTISSTSTESNNFGIIAVTGQDSVIADSVNDTVTFNTTGGMTITTDDLTDTITFDSRTYTISAENTSTGDAFIQLLGSDSSVDSVEIAAGPGIEVERIDSSRIEIRQTFPTWDSLGSLTWDDLA